MNLHETNSQEQAQRVCNIAIGCGAHVLNIHQIVLAKDPVRWMERGFKGSKTVLDLSGLLGSQSNCGHLGTLYKEMSIKDLMEETQPASYGKN